MSSSGSDMLINSEKWDPTEPSMFYANGDYSSWKVKFEDFIQYTDSDLWTLLLNPTFSHDEKVISEVILR